MTRVRAAESRRNRVILLLMHSGVPQAQAERMTIAQAFGDDMLAADFKVREYEPRYGDYRIAVKADDEVELQKVIRATDITLTWDTLGMGYIVYPRERDEA